MLAIVTVGTLLTGVLLVGIGALRASRAIRFIPQPIVGGFNAASGLLVMLGSARILSGPGFPAKLGAALAIGATMVLLRRRIGAVAMPIVFLAAVLLCAGGVQVLHVPIDRLRAGGWFFNVPPSHAWIPLLELHAPIAWSVVFAALPSLAVLALVSATTLLFNASGLELLTGVDVDLDRELRLSGIGNLIGALFGGMVSYVSLARSSMIYDLGARGRSIGITVAAGAAVAIAIGPARVLDAIPTIAPAGLLLALGAGMLERWLLRARRNHSIGDYLTLCAIFAAILAFGFVPGLIVGLAVGCVTFVVRYARIDAVAHRSTVQRSRSSLERSLHEAEVLAQYGECVRIFTLRGYVFFGIADRLYRELNACASDAGEIAWIVVDFTQVSGMDSSATAAFVKFARNVDADRVSFMLCGMSERVSRRCGTRRSKANSIRCSSRAVTSLWSIANRSC